MNSSMIKKTRFQLLDLSLFIRARARLIGILALTLGTLFLTQTPAQANAVLNLRNVSVANSSMSFTWSNQTGRSYILAISSHSSFSSRVTSGTTPANQNTTSYFNLAPNTTYFFRVKVSTDADGSYNATFSSSTLANLPGPSTAAAVNISSIAINLSGNGNPLTPRTTYQVQMGTDTTYTPFTSSTTVLLTSTFTGLGVNTTYYFRVQAFSRLMVSTAFNLDLTTVTLSRTPGVNSFIVGTSSIEVRVTTNTNPALTRVDVSSSAGFGIANTTTGVFAPDPDIRVTTLTLSNLLANATYQVQFRTLNWQLRASSISATVLSTATEANPPSNSTFSVTNISSITIFWNSNGNQLTPPTSYQMSVSTSSDFIMNSSSNTFLLQATSATLRPNTTYFFQVRTNRRLGGTSAFNAVLSTATRSLAPALFNYVLGSSSAEVRLTTNSNPATTRVDVTTGVFNVNISSFDISNSSFAAFYNMLITTVTIQNLTPNATYQFRFRTVNWQNLPSTNSATVLSTATFANPPGPSLFNVAPATVTISSITVDWDNNGNQLTPPTSYQMRVSTSSDFAVFSTSITFNTFATSSTLRSNTTYFFRIAAYQRFGGTSPFNTDSSTVTLARAPGFAGFNIGVSSISVRFSTNTNPVRTEVDLSSGNFELTSSSFAAFYNLRITTVVLSNLEPNTTYQFVARAENWQNVASSQIVVTASTCTYTFVPGISTASSVNLSSITVDWDPNGNPLTPPTSYEMQISSAVNFTPFSSSVTFNTAADTGTLLPNTSYFFRVRSFNRFGAPSAFNALMSTVTLANPPGDSTSTLVTASTISVSWTANGNPLPPSTSYQMQISTSADFVPSGSSTTFRLLATTNTLRPNTTYFFQVRTFNRLGLPTTFNALISTPTLSVAPGIFNFVMGTSSASIRLSTNSNPAGTLLDVTSGFYNINTSSFQVENSSFAAFYNMNLTTVTFSNLTPNTTYQFLSRTRNWQNIPSSNSAVVIVTATYANPPGPSLFNTAPAEVFFSSITLDWDNNGNPLTPPTSYQMQVSSSSDFARASSSTTFNTFATTATLLTNTTYFFRVAAFHRFGSSSAYNAVVSTPTLSRAPAFQGFNIGVSSISVRFSTNTNPARTEVDLSSGNFELTTSSFAAFYNSMLITTVTLSNLAPNTTYQFLARTENWQNIASSQVVIADTSTLAYAPGNSTSTLVGVSSISVFWTPNGNPLTPPTSYEMQISTAFNFAPFASSVTFNLWSSTVGLNANTTYFFQVRAFNRLGVPTTFNLLLSTPTASTAPGVSGFKIFNTSASVMLSTNTNPAGTRVAVTSGAFEVNTSSFSNFYNLPVTTVSLSNLNPNTVYQFLTQTLNWQGVGSTSSIIAQATATLPNIPSGTAFTQVNTTSMSISWSNNGNPLTPPTSYQVEISSAPNFTGTVYSSSATFTLACTSTTLTPNSSYYFHVRAEGVGGTDSIYDTTIASYTKAATPATLASTYTAVSSFSITVNWGANSNPSNTRYTLDISSAPNFTGNLTTSSSTFNVFATTGGLTENTTRYFRVQAFNQWGYPSDYLIFGATAAAGNPPSAITNLSTFTATNLGEVEVRWTAPGEDGLFGVLPAGTSFYIATTTVLANAIDPNYWTSRRNSSADIIIATSNVSPASNQGILLSGLEINSTYFMRAWTRDEKGNFSDLSNGATFYPNFEEIGVLIIGSTNYDFGFIDLAVSTVSVSSFTVRNVGNVKHDFSLSATTMTPNTPWSISTTSSTDQAIVWGGFSTSRPAASSFGTEDIILNNSQLSDTTKYAIGTSSGTAVGINEDRYLWMRVDMPLITSTTEQQRIKVVITGSKAP